MNDKQLPKRKNLRLRNYNYSSNGCYFVTICAKDKNYLFGRYNVGALHEASANHAQNRCIILNGYGELVEKTIKNIREKFKEITIDNYIVMPNHIHLLLSINNGIDAERALREAPLQRSVLSKAVGYLKMNVSKEIHKTNPMLEVWQKRYIDHIIRNQTDFENHWNYIEYNALKEYE